MKIEKSQVTKIRISEVKGLDPILVIVEDLGPRQGSVIIECWNESWSAYWGGLGNRTITEFFCSCDEYYLAKKLSSIPGSVTDFDRVNEDCKEAGLDVSVETNGCLALHYEDLEGLYGERLYDLPEKENPDYQYLCRIILAVQEALKSNTLPTARKES